MVQIILASHGDLAKGMKDTLNMIIGDVSMIESFSSYRDEYINTREAIETTIKENYDKKNIFILTDIFGGSVNTEVMSLISKYPKIHVFSGMNLPLAISLATQVDEITENSLQEIIQESKNGIVDCNKLIIEYKNSQEEEL